MRVTYISYRFESGIVPSGKSLAAAHRSAFMTTARLALILHPRPLAPVPPPFPRRRTPTAFLPSTKTCPAASKKVLTVIREISMCIACFCELGLMLVQRRAKAKRYNLIDHDLLGKRYHALGVRFDLSMKGAAAEAIGQTRLEWTFMSHTAVDNLRTFHLPTRTYQGPCNAAR